MPLSPHEALFNGEVQPAQLPVCDHYAGNLPFLYKALALQAKLGPVFDITCDLEDGAASLSAEAALVLAAEFAGVIASPHNLHRRIGVRVHPAGDARCEAELELLLGACGEQLAYVMLPKAQSLSDVERIIEMIRSASLIYSLKKPPALHVLIETHGALRDVHAIAALRGVESLSFGLMDFVSAHHGAISSEAMRSPGQFEHALVRRAKLEISAACHAHGKVPSHNVCVDVKNPAQAGADAARAQAEFGYTRMWSIHPAQIEPIVAALSPTSTELATAKRVIDAAHGANWAPISLDGTLHDRASYRYFWTLLQRNSPVNTQ
jgi:citrate lyase subunit beta / citryl-CoA lyase